MGDFENVETLCTEKYAYAINKYVSITTMDNKEFKTWLVTVDPVSGNCLTVRIGNGKLMSIMLFHSDYVSDIRVLEDPPDAEACGNLLDNLFKETTISFQSEELLKRKSAVISMMKKYRLPVRECDEDVNIIQVGDSLTIYPPYDCDSCISGNEIILKKVSEMLSKLVIN